MNSFKSPVINKENERIYIGNENLIVMKNKWAAFTPTDYLICCNTRNKKDVLLLYKMQEMKEE